MTDTIPPALTPGEWADRTKRGAAGPDRGVCVSADDRSVGVSDAGHGVSVETSAMCRALAALALHGEPFGFTHADVVLIDDAIEQVWNAAAENRSGAQDATTNRVVTGLAVLRDRIAALLPPGSPT